VVVVVLLLLLVVVVMVVVVKHSRPVPVEGTGCPLEMHGSGGGG